MPTIEEVSLLSKGVEAFTTIKGNKENSTNFIVTQAETTCCLQHVAGHFNDLTFAHSATTNRIKNLPLVVQYVRVMNDILGKSPYCIKGKIVRGQPTTIETEVLPLPKNHLKHNQILTLCVDVMFMNKVALSITVF